MVGGASLCPFTTPYTCNCKLGKIQNQHFYIMEELFLFAGGGERGGEQQGANTEEITQMGLALIEKFYRFASQKSV